LEKIGYQVYIPIFPTPENQNLESWLKVIGDLRSNIGAQTIFIGHSVGASFILSILESLDLPVRAAFLVSGFLGLLDNEEFDNLNKEFVDRKFDWDKIKSNTQKFYLYHSNNDPYVPVEKAYELATNLCVKPIIIENGGHFNEKAGYKEFPRLLSDIKNI